MPRPKRAKVAPSAPAPRIRQPAKSAPAAVAPKAAASKLSPDNIYDVSDPDEGVVTNVRRVKKGNGKGKEPASRGRDVANDSSKRIGDLNALGGLGDEEAETGGALFDDIDLDSSSIEVSRREMNNTPLVENSRLSLANFRRRPRQPSILGRGPARARSSSIESNLAEDNGLTSVGRRNTSALGMGNVRGRQRNASVTRNAVYAAPSSMGLDIERGTPAHTGSVLNLGNFKRRAREPSILGTAQKRQQERPAFDDDDEEDFNPDDESTPLNFNRARGMNTSPVMAAAGSSSNPRKRKLSDIQVPRSSPSLPSPIASRAEEAVPATMSNEEEDENDSVDSVSEEELELPMPSIERPITPEPLSETMAPPQSSSSPSPGSPDLPILIRRQPSSRLVPSRTRITRGRTPPPRTQDSPISSPPSLTHSPNRPVFTAKQKARTKPVPPPSTFSTAQLQTLMPRRRRRINRDPFDFPSDDDGVDVSGLASDDDELSHLAVRPRPRRSTARTPAVNKSKTKPKTTTIAGKRTYGSSRPVVLEEAAEEEADPNESLGPLPDNDVGEENAENSQELEQRVGLELKQATRKFKEVDQWELEFEDITASSDSPRDAR